MSLHFPASEARQPNPGQIRQGQWTEYKPVYPSAAPVGFLILLASKTANILQGHRDRLAHPNTRCAPQLSAIQGCEWRDRRQTYLDKL
jgi:hypothetical protein